ncbi:hypothetical protein DFH08DRAFT_796921 [Mycena albidolilacea]|uniref:Uncharacterized protein n=1 Tax=Mycena albidolilacea TaxID=1033008 RepID=A0AAD7F726_9AGAR|nr:hypothetical protein DFH08DRAFT_796921 [Mycena albidolilacea]
MLEAPETILLPTQSTLYKYSLCRRRFLLSSRLGEYSAVQYWRRRERRRRLFANNKGYYHPQGNIYYIENDRSYADHKQDHSTSCEMSNTVGTTTPHTTAPISVPSPSSGSKNVVIDVTTSSDISWDGDCVASSNAQYMGTFDGEETNYGDPNSSNSTSTSGNCTFGWSGTNLSTGPHLLGIMIFGASSSDTKRDFESPWSVEVQNLVATQPDSSVGSDGSGGAVPKSASTSFAPRAWFSFLTILVAILFH